MSASSAEQRVAEVKEKYGRIAVEIGIRLD